MIGFGNPLLDGPDARYSNRAKLAGSTNAVLMGARSGWPQSLDIGEVGLAPGDLLSLQTLLDTCNWLRLTSHTIIGDLAANTYANVLTFNRARRMVRCFHDGSPCGRATIMKTITSALTVLVFLSFFVWISTLAIAGGDRRVPGWYGPHDPSPAWN